MEKLEVGSKSEKESYDEKGSGEEKKDEGGGMRRRRARNVKNYKVMERGGRGRER